MAATSAPRIGVLAIQGAFREHVRSLCLCGAETVEIRTREDLEGLSGLVFPGGESTVMGKFLIEWGMMDRVRELILSGMPVFGTCAGLILLCSDILDHPGQPRIGLLNASVRRNAFGRQIDSFTTPLELCPFPTASGNPTDQPPLEAVFIRAPLIEKIGPGVEVLARVNVYSRGGPTLLPFLDVQLPSAIKAVDDPLAFDRGQFPQQGSDQRGQGVYRLVRP